MIRVLLLLIVIAATSMAHGQHVPLTPNAAAFAVNRNAQWEMVKPTIAETFSYGDAHVWWDDLRQVSESKYIATSLGKSFTAQVGPQDFGGQMPASFSVLLPRSFRAGFIPVRMRLYTWNGNGTLSEDSDHFERRRGHPTWAAFNRHYDGPLQQRDYYIEVSLEPVE